MFLSYLSFLTFSACVVMGIIVLLLDKKSGQNRAFAVFSFIISFWAFGDIFYYIAKDQKSLWFWYRITSIGWCGMIFGTFYICLEFAGYYKKIPFYIKVFIFLYSLALIIIQFTGTLFVDKIIIFKDGPHEMMNVSSPGFYLYYAGFSLVVIICAFFIIKSMLESTSIRMKKMLRDYLLLLIVGYGFGSGTDALLPYLKIPPFGSFFILIFLSGILYLIRKYRLLQLDYRFLQNKAFDVLSDIIIIITPDKKTVNINDAAKTSIKLQKKDAASYFADKNTFDKYLSLAASKKNILEKKYILLKGNKNIPASLSVCPIFDKFNDLIGYILICKPLYSFEQTVINYGISPQEKKVIFSLREGLMNKEIAYEMQISEGVIKNYIYSIYKKTKVNNRTGLLQLFFPAEN